MDTHLDDTHLHTRPGTVHHAAPLSVSMAAPAAVLGALLVLAGDAYHLFVLDDRPTQAGTAAYTTHGVALMLGLLLLLLAALSVARPGRLARVALPAMVVGTALVVGDIWAEVVVLPGVVMAERGSCWARTSAASTWRWWSSPSLCSPSDG